MFAQATIFIITGAVCFAHACIIQRDGDAIVRRHRAFAARGQHIGLPRRVRDGIRAIQFLAARKTLRRRQRADDGFGELW